LAGDALISFGAQIILNSQTPNKEKVLNLYLKSAGALGIVGGQTLDILCEGKKIDFETLQTIHKYKTGALFECAMLSGALCADADKNKIESIEEFAQNFGLVFQIYDDILDEISTSNDIGKTAGKDKLKQKATYVTIFSLDEAKNKLNCLIQKCYDILKKENIGSSVFGAILNSISKRING
jgi:geranylgeranyl diphosphate synthase type II